jgi:hypothetical protein
MVLDKKYCLCHLNMLPALQRRQSIYSTTCRALRSVWQRTHHGLLEIRVAPTPHDSPINQGVRIQSYLIQPVCSLAHFNKHCGWQPWAASENVGLDRRWKFRRQRHGFHRVAASRLPQNVRTCASPIIDIGAHGVAGVSDATRVPGGELALRLLI